QRSNGAIHANQNESGGYSIWRWRFSVAIALALYRSCHPHCRSVGSHPVSHLFSPFQLRGVTFKNRIFVSPMCQYSSDDGFPTDWHLVRLGSRAVGGAALVMVEASAVSPEGRISENDSGLWSPAHGQAFARIVRFIKEQG